MTPAAPLDLKDGKYTAVPPGPSGRRPIPELELEVALLDGWVRYWFRDELLPLPGDLLQQLNAAREALAAARSELDAERQARRALEEEVARLRDEAAKAKGQA